MARLQTFTLVTKKVHMYLGLLNLSILLVFGIAGLKATFKVPGSRKPAQPVVRTEDFTVPSSVIDDKQLAEQVRSHLNIAAVDYNWRRDPQNNLAIAYYTHSGPRRVTVLERENKLSVAVQQENIWSFFDNLHGTANRHPSDVRVKLWTWYNEFSVWSLIAMSLSGVYLWLASRPGYRWAQISFVVGCGCFLALYFLSR